MLSLPILEIAISLSFLYCLLSLFVTVVQEMFASLLRLRGHMLYEGVKHMLDDEDATSWVKDFYAHPLVFYMARHSGKKHFAPRPSYLSKATFLTALRDMIRDKAIASGADAESTLPTSIQHLLNEGSHLVPVSTRKVLLAFWREAGGDVKAFEKRVGDWFDDTMERVSGWYKRQAQNWALGLGMAVALLMNVDTLAIAKKLATDTQARQTVTQQAVAFSGDSAATTLVSKVSTQSQSSQAMPQPDSLSQVIGHTDTLGQQGKVVLQNLGQAQGAMGFGWRREAQCDDKGLTYPICLVVSSLRAEFCLGRSGVCRTPTGFSFAFFVLFKLMGYLATASAIALGAPFWFDMLSRLVKLRGSGQKPQSEG